MSPLLRRKFCLKVAQVSGKRISAIDNFLSLEPDVHYLHKVTVLSANDSYLIKKLNSKQMFIYTKN